MLSQRLKQLRLARGFSLEALAAEMGGIVTKQALSKYEKGTIQPSHEVLNKLATALKVKAAHLWSEPAVSVKILAYRKGSRLPKKEQAQIESLTQHRLEERVRLQSLLVSQDAAMLPIRKKTIRAPEAAEQAAEEIRKLWNLGVGPIASVTGVLEDHRIHVLEIDAGEKFDGISAVAYDRDQQALAAAVVTRRGLPGERQRFSLMHEFAHLVGCESETAAFRFAAAFLAPASAVSRELGSKRVFIQQDELFLFKRRYGMSVQAILYRMRDLGIIGETYYRQWCIEVSRRGWKRQEPFEIPAEQATWLHQSVLRVLSEGVLSKEEAEEMVGEEIKVDLPLSLVQRRAFMRLPLEERRRLLAEQAEKLEAAYAEDPEVKGLGGGDIVEY